MVSSPHCGAGRTGRRPMSFMEAEKISLTVGIVTICCFS
jgi:hypothetical protein